MKKLQKKVALMKKMGMFRRDDTRFTVKRASTGEELENAYRLVHDMFVEKHYIDEQEGGIRLRVLEAFPEMATFVCEDDGKTVAVMSVVVDSADMGLPSDAGFKQELDELRSQKRRVCEFTNLAVDGRYWRSNAFTALTQACYAQAMAWGCDDIFIAISPGHASFFEEVLGFDHHGDERNYSEEKEDIVQGKRLNLRTIRPRWREMDRLLEDQAFIHDYYCESNPYHSRIADWARAARSEFLKIETLNHLFVECSDFFSHCNDVELQAVIQRWGSRLFNQVYYGIRNTEAIGGLELVAPPEPKLAKVASA